MDMAPHIQDLDAEQRSVELLQTPLWLEICRNKLSKNVSDN